MTKLYAVGTVALYAAAAAFSVTWNVVAAHGAGFPGWADMVMAVLLVSATAGLALTIKSCLLSWAARSASPEEAERIDAEVRRDVYGH